MPVTKSAKKALRRDQRRTQVNLRIKRRVRASVKKYQTDQTQENLNSAFSLLDRAAKKNVFHKNKSNRLKSKLAKTVKPSAN